MSEETPRPDPAPSHEHVHVDIPDDELPEDLRPTDDNPLAKGLPPGEGVPDLLEAGKHATEDDEDDQAAERQA
ncbi:hypothetical protein GHK92_06085 [Nocardioides sp. dk4132]|uniref:hypothetical protein n=1 Tax=unclassified Nocardioides TaxID=2615069 RepID=UPI001297CD48|nr:MULTISPECIES: hypothetical protein [unclassified Nocardioides]MQW75436.1 hypothetical protein [Nocardioides sp. dk4132]QGA08359.1 hypothetical protein GFH29_13830 [Nocardioides sp. dk884]